MIVTLGGCTRSLLYQRYEPARLEARPLAVVGDFNGRRLDDPELLEFLRTAGAASTDGGWSPRQLALVALARHPDLTVARAELAAAWAAERSAGLRSEPSTSAGVERATAADEGKSSHWSFSLTSGLTFETGGKRAARRARARAVSLEARLRLDMTGWDVAQEAALAAHLLVATTRAVVDADVEASATREVVTLLRARYAEGRVTLADVAQAESEGRSAALASAQSRLARSEVAGSLARALGIPLSVIDTLTLRPPVEDAVGACRAATASADSLYAVALLHRFDLGVALTEYAVTEVDLRMEIARQFPDLVIGPGIGWDQGVVRWVLGFGTPAIPRDRNRGPIAQAQARRSAQAGRVRATQDSVLAGVDAARTACEAIGSEVAAADSVRRSVQHTVALAEAAYARGETGQTEVALAHLARLRAVRATHQAMDRGALAGIALETASGSWLDGEPLEWPDLSRQSRTHGRGERLRP